MGLIVLDEVHYLGDPGRGSVWEEVIINCPSHICMLAMSATIANAEELGGWITQVKPLPSCSNDRLRQELSRTVTGQGRCDGCVAGALVICGLGKHFPQAYARGKCFPRR